MRGVTLYVGTTGTGKTYAALQDLQALAMPAVILDLGGSALLQKIPKAGASLKASRGIVRYIPETGDELDAALNVLYRRGNVAILIDDSAALPSRELAKLCRLWRPRNLRILLTTQHISGDIGQVIQACDPLIYAFRTTSTRSLEWLEKWHGIQPEEVKGLAMGQALELSF